MKRIVNEEFSSLNMLSVTVEHNGYMGGDAGHGGYVKLIFEDISSTCMELNGNKCDRFDFIVRGDSERDTLVASLKMIVKELEQKTR